MNKLSKILYSKSNIFICLVMTLVMILYASIIMGTQSKCISAELTDEQSLLGLRFGYDFDDVTSLFDTLSNDALKCYSRLLTVWDNIFPFIYATMYILWLSLIFKKKVFKPQALSLINLYPVIPMLLDFAENHFENALVKQYLDLNTIIELNVQAASTVTQIKWIFSLTNYIIIVTGIILLIKNRQRTTRHRIRAEGDGARGPDMA